MFLMGLVIGFTVGSVVTAAWMTNHRLSNEAGESTAQYILLANILLTCTVVSFWITWEAAQTIGNASYAYLKKWKKSPDIEPLRGLFGKMVMRNVKNTLKERYGDLPKTGDLIQGNASEIIYVVTSRHQPDPISPFGHVELLRLDKNTTTRVAVLDFFKESYEKVTPDEKNSQR